MSLKTPRHNDAHESYYAAKRPSPSPNPMFVGRAVTSSMALPTRALMRPKRSMSCRPEQRPRLVSHPSGSGSSHHSGSMTGQYGGSVRESPFMKRDQSRQMTQIEVEDDEDGSMVLVRVPRKNIMPVHSINAIRQDSPTAQQATRVNKALSVDDLRCEYIRNRRHVSGTELTGLTMAMTLESQMLLLKRKLCLYQAFDESSGEIYIPSTHDEFFTIINQNIVELSKTAHLLGNWSYNRKSNNQAFQIQKHLRTAYEVVKIWNMFFDWKLGPSEKMVREQRGEGKVRKATWERRRKECGDTVGTLLRLVGDVEMDEGVKGVLDMQNELRCVWKSDGRVGRREAESMGWVWDIRL